MPASSHPRRQPSRWSRGVALGAATLALAAGLMTPCRADPISIDSLAGVDASGALQPGKVTVGLNDQLAVVLNVDARHGDRSAQGRALPGRARDRDLNDTLYRANDHALVFHLLRTPDNAAAWQPLLGAPGFTPRSVNVGLVLEAPAAGTPTALLARPDRQQPSFDLLLLPRRWLLMATLAALGVVAVVVLCARRTNILRDAMLPQLPPAEQPYSLGRAQMAFWFAIIFTAYTFLYVLLWDYNTLTSQALMLMGLSGATAVFAVAIDAGKNTPMDAANETLRAIGLRTYQDVLQLDQDIAQRQTALQQAPADAADDRRRLQTEIADRLNKKRSWRALTRPYVSEGWWRDLSTDINGPALHRVQLIVWTLAFGAMFVIGLYRTLSMPQFSELQLALMGITSAGYLGFKYPEQQH